MKLIIGLAVLAAICLIVAAMIDAGRKAKEEAQSMPKGKKPYQGDLKGTDNCPRCGQAMKVRSVNATTIQRICRCKDGAIVTVTIEEPRKCACA